MFFTPTIFIWIVWIVGSCYSSPILDLEKNPYDLDINVAFAETSMGSQETNTTISSNEEKYSKENSDKKSAISDSLFSLENNKSDFSFEYLPQSFRRGHDRFSPFERMFLTSKHRHTTPRIIHFPHIMVDEGMKSLTSIDHTKHIKNNSHMIPATYKSAFKDIRPTLELFRDLPQIWERDTFSPFEIMFYSDGQRHTTHAPHIHKKKQPHSYEQFDQLYFHGPSLIRQKTNRSFQLPVVMEHSEVIIEPKKNASFIDLNTDSPYEFVPWMSELDIMQKLLNDFVTIISKDIEGKTIFRESLPMESDEKLNLEIKNGDLISDILLPANSNVPVHHHTRRSSVKNIGILDGPSIITRAASFQAPFIENILKHASNPGFQNDGVFGDIVLAAKKDVPLHHRTRRDSSKNLTIFESNNIMKPATFLALFNKNGLEHVSHPEIKNDGVFSDVILSANNDVPLVHHTKRDLAKNTSLGDGPNVTHEASFQAPFIENGLKHTSTNVLGNRTLTDNVSSTEKTHSNLIIEHVTKTEKTHSNLTIEHVTKTEVRSVFNTTASVLAEINSSYPKIADDKNIKTKLDSDDDDDAKRSLIRANDSKIKGGESDKNRQVESKSAELGSVHITNDSVKETRAINMHEQGKLKSDVSVADSKTNVNDSSAGTVATGEVKQVDLGSNGSNETKKTEDNVTHIQQRNFEKLVELDKASGQSINQSSLNMATKLSNVSTVTEVNETQMNHTESHIMHIPRKLTNASTSNPAIGEDGAKFAKENIKSSPENSMVRYYIAGSVLPVVVGVFLVVALYIVRQNKRPYATRPSRNRVAAAEMKEIIHEPMRAQVC